MKALEVYFNNLAVTNTNEKTVLEQLVASNAKFAATNEELVAIVKKLTNKNKDLQRETNRLKKRGGSGETLGKRNPTVCPHFRKEGYHESRACFELAKNKYKRPPGLRIWL